jgi:hypothetical protein
LIDIAKARFQAEKFSAVVIGFVTHHYSSEDKREFYLRAAGVLERGGILVHGDLFSYGSKWLAALAHQVGEDWITKQLTNPDSNLQSRFDKIRHIAARLRNAWLTHWNFTHVYAPVQWTSKSFSGDCLDHVTILRQLGFCEVECPFRLWELGIIWARL